MQEPSRLSTCTGFLYPGKLVEYGVTEELLVNPLKRHTGDDITARSG